MADHMKYTSLPQDPDHTPLSKFSLPKMTRRKVVLFLFILFGCVTTVMYAFFRTGTINCTHFCDPPVLPLRNTSCPHPLLKQRLPQALIIGIRKAGTRALLAGLKIHPDIVTAAKEVHFFDDNESYNKGLESYRLSLPFSTDEQLTIEKSPSYFIVPETPSRIYAMNSSIKLLLLVREPVDRTVSDYSQLMEKKQMAGDEVIPFEDEVLREDGSVDILYTPIQISLYYKHMQKWLSYFPLEQILFVDGDQFQKNPYTELNKVEQFLGLKPYITEDMFVFNETKGFYCFEGVDKMKCLGATKGRKHPDINPKVIKTLQDYFHPYNLKFFDLINRTFDWP